MAFIVFHCETGAMDGVYATRDWADETLEHLREQYAGHFLLLEIVAGESDYVIPDHLFWASEPMRSAVEQYAPHSP